jgi:heterodisulfide reductase subunit B
MGKSYDMPIVYITQLIGLCLGISAEELGFEKLMIPASGVLKTVGSAA